MLLRCLVPEACICLDPSCEDVRGSARIVSVKKQVVGRRRRLVSLIWPMNQAKEAVSQQSRVQVTVRVNLYFVYCHRTPNTLKRVSFSI